MRTLLIVLALYIPQVFASDFSAVCDGGNLKIYQQGKTGLFVAEVRDIDAIDYFEYESQQMGPATSDGTMFGLHQMVEKKFPDNVFIDYSEEGIVLRITDLTRVNRRTLVSKQYGPRLRVYRKGVDLKISAMRDEPYMGNVYYDIGHWFFGGCDVTY